MTDSQPKRRGRPPGSKNKTIPNIIAVGDDPVPPDNSWLNEPEHIDRTNEPASIESWTAGPVGVQVLVRFKAGLSTAPIEQTLDWPQGWPIPQLNDVVRFDKEIAGRVQYVEYDYGSRVIIITAT